MSNLRKHIDKIKDETEMKKVSRMIVESRIQEIVGDSNFFDRYNLLDEEKKIVLSYQLFCELNELESFGLIEEETDLWTAFKGLFGGFGGIMSSGVETLAEPIIGKALGLIGFDTNWYWTKVIISYMTTRPSELIRSFSSCELFSKLLAKAMVEAFIMELQEGSGAIGNNLIVDFLRNSIAGSMKGYTDPLAEKLSEKVCGFFSSLVKNIGSLQGKLAGT